LLTGCAQHHIAVLLVEYSVEIIAQIWRPTAVIDLVHCMCCKFNIQTTKPVYNIWNDLQRSLEVIGNIDLH